MMNSRIVALSGSIFSLLLLNCQTPVWANMPPGFMMSSTAGFLCLPVMILLTFIAGGYSIIARRREAEDKLKGIAKLAASAFLWIGSIIILLWCLMWACGVILFVVPIARSIDLISLGLSKKRMGDQAPPYLADANPTRLILAGSLLAIISVGAGAWSCWAISSMPEPKILQAALRGNMRTCQLAAEHYATNHKGLYPESSKNPEFRSYYPGGSQGKEPLVSGVAPTNPSTKLAEWPIDGTLKDVEAARQADRKTSNMDGKYVVEYSPIFNEKQEPQSYAVRGSDQEGHPIPGVGGSPLVLSNK